MKFAWLFTPKKSLLRCEVQILDHFFRTVELTYDTITFVNETGNLSTHYWEYVTTDLAPIQNWDEVIAMDFIDKTSSLMRFFVDFIDDFVFEIDDIISDLCDYYDDVSFAKNYKNKF